VSKGSKQDSGGAGKPASAPRGNSPLARRQARQRKERMEEIERQVEDGSLVIRPMTAAERKKYPPRPRKPRRGGRR
jgi:hypothetical protein